MRAEVRGLRLTVHDRLPPLGPPVFGDLSFALEGGALAVTGPQRRRQVEPARHPGGAASAEGGSKSASKERASAPCRKACTRRPPGRPQDGPDGGGEPGFARDLLGEPGLAPADALERVGLDHAARLPVGYLSAGQRRRVALARLLVALVPSGCSTSRRPLDSGSQAFWRG